MEHIGENKKKKKKNKVTELIDVTAVHVSYVDRGANLRKFLVRKDMKDIDDKSLIEHQVKIISKKEDQKTVLGIVYEPWEIDADGEFMRPETISKMAHTFMEHYRAIDKDHNLIPGAGRVLESSIAPTDMEIGNQVVKEGTWLLLTKAADDETWEKIKADDYTGYSLWGFAKEIKEYDIEEYQQLMKNINNDRTVKYENDGNKTVSISKDFEEELANDENNNVFRFLYMLEGAFWKIDGKRYWGEITAEEAKEEMLKSIDQFKNKISSMSFEIQKQVSKVFKNINENWEENMENKEILKHVEEQLDKKFAETSKDLSDKIEKIVEVSTSLAKAEDITKSIAEIRDSIKESLDEKFKKLNEDIAALKQAALESSSDGSTEEKPEGDKKEKSSSSMLGIV